jgi:drug/metabolite transporter (DMT)-like permease
MIVLLFVMYALLATMYTIAKAVLAYSQPLFFVAFRMTLAGLMLLSYDLFCTKRLRSVAWRRDGVLLVQLILFHIYLVYVLDLLALTEMTSYRSALWYSLTPFFTAFFAYLLHLETITWKKIAGLCIGFIGMTIDTPPMVDGFDFSFGLRWYDICTIIAAASGSYGWITFKRLSDRGEYSTFFLNGFAMLCGGLLTGITSAITELRFGYPVISWWPFLQLTLSIILLGNIFFYSLYGYMLRFYTTTFLSFAGFLCPFFAGLFGWFFLAEPISSTFFLSLFLVCIGLYVFHHDELTKTTGR